MNDGALLLEIYRLESASFLRYAAGAEPYVPAECRELEAVLRKQSADHLAALEELRSLIAALRLPPPPAPSYPAAFTSYNYLDVRKLARTADEYGAAETGRLRPLVERLTTGAGRNVCERLLRVKI